MALDLSKYAVNKGSGRSRLPDRPTFTGVQMTGYTTAQRMALTLGTADEGLVVYDKDENALVVWTGAGWNDTDASAVAAQPTFTSVAPTGGTTAGGTALTITGTHLTGTTGVTVGGAAATSVVVVSDTSVTCVSPVGTAGAKSIVVTTKDGSVTGAGAYTYA